MMKLTIDARRSRARLEPEGESGDRLTTTGTPVPRVPLAGEFLRMDGGEDRLAKVVAVIWEPDGCITLELDGGRERDGAAEDACSNIAEWWFG